MKRRDFLRLAGALPAGMAIPGLTLAGGTPTARINDGWRVFELSYDIELIDNEGAARLWLPVPATTTEGYQRLLGHRWQSNAAKVVLESEPAYRSQALVAEWRDGDTPRRLQATFKVATRDYAVDLRHAAPRAGDDPTQYLKPTPHMPIDGVVGETAQRIAGGVRDPLTRARLVYDWVVDNSFRDPNVLGCGNGDIRHMLESGNLGGKCADLNALFVGLARAVGLPAREVYGVRVADSRFSKSMGKSGDVSKAQHCRAEFHLEGVGWVPVDPADVRKVILEEKRQLDDPRIVELRERLFGNWEMNWVAFNSARDFQPATAAEKPLNYFMYPYAETKSHVLNGLRPDQFNYAIQSRELTA
ncbi:MAG: transglutaminase family protein [Ectothiorhodospiraceae bacterium]|jgi:transglutaminase-like putative cysteine protease|nr:transglutaminase family protein [Ectothiorhodospiraceae bacterium]